MDQRPSGVRLRVMVGARIRIRSRVRPKRTEPRLGQGSDLGIITRLTLPRQVKPSPTVWAGSQVHVL